MKVEVIILFCVTALSTVMTVPIPVFKTNGTFQQVGYNIGAHFKDKIQRFYNINKDLHEKLLPFYKTDDGKKVYNELLDRANTMYPQYMSELDGIARGSQLDFAQVFLMTIRTEMLYVLGFVDSLKGCSDVMVYTSDTYGFGHNEDTDPTVKDLAYIVDVNITEGQYHENFISYTYPGMLPGKAFGFNYLMQTALSVNALYPAQIALNTAPRDLVNRGIAGSQNPYYLMRNLYVSAAYGFSTNLAITAGPENSGMSNFELVPNGDDIAGFVNEMVVEQSSSGSQKSKGDTRNNVTWVTGHYMHFNIYSHTSNVRQVLPAIVSSQHRFARAQQMQVPKTFQDIREILGDTKDPNYPIYRTPRATDLVVTSATAIFDLKACTMEVMTSNPKTAEDKQVFSLACNPPVFT